MSSHGSRKKLHHTVTITKKHRFRVNTRTLLKPVLQESSALGDCTAPKQYLKLNGHFSPNGYGMGCDGECRTHSLRYPQLASATRKPAANRFAAHRRKSATSNNYDDHHTSGK